jgi:hypothetical protein
MDKKERKPEVVKGQKINVDVFKGKKGTFPMGKYGSIVCKLFIPKSVGHIDYGCTCLCKVTEVGERSLTVTVEEVVRSTAANNFELQKKLKSVVAPDQKGEKVKRNYAFAEAFEKSSKKIK